MAYATPICELVLPQLHPLTSVLAETELVIKRALALLISFGFIPYTKTHPAYV